MKKIFGALAVVALATAALAYASYERNRNKPLFVSVAEHKTNNYLQSSFGPGTCRATSTLDKNWEMVCLYDGDDISIEYSVHPVMDNPAKNGSHFFLVPKNELATEAKGLARYLDLRVI